MQSLKAYNANAGVTLIEVIVVLGLLSMMLAVGMVMSMSSISRGTLIGERDLLVSLLIGARARAMANVDERSHGVYIGVTNFTTFEGSSYVAGDPSNRDVPRTSSAVVVGPTTVVFSQLSANVALGAGTIEMGSGGASTTIEVGQYGRLEW